MTEEQLHTVVVQWIRHSLGESALFFHPPNGGQRHKAVAAKLKAQGVRPGVPDLVFILPGGRAAFLELKTDRGRLTEAQRQFQTEVTQLGCPYAVCRSLDEVEGTLKAWGVSLKGRLAA